MAEYIERENAVEELEKAPAYFDSGDIRYGIEISIDSIKKQPAEDVVKVVRCKDCRYWEALGGYWNDMHHREDGCCNALIKFHDSERYCTMQDHFCSYGELKEREGK